MPVLEGPQGREDGRFRLLQKTDSVQRMPRDPVPEVGEGFGRFPSLRSFARLRRSIAFLQDEKDVHGVFSSAERIRSTAWPSP